MSATIVMADDGIPFDGTSVDTRPLGGAETSFIGLAQGLAARGHHVSAFTKGDRRFEHEGVSWAPIADGLPDAADLYIANRSYKLLSPMMGARRTAFWIHNPAGYVLKRRYLWPLWRRRPTVVFLGDFHATTLPGWVPTGGRRVIPYGINAHFRQAAERSPPAPKAVFTSNPLRRLDWVLERWDNAIYPTVPGAELHIYSSLATYGGGNPKNQALAAPVLALARTLSNRGVVLHPPVSKPDLATAMVDARVLLYGGDPGETFCLAVAETQALGIPGVVSRSTCLAERVVDGVTGFVLEDQDGDGFARRAVQVLNDDTLWRAQHRAALTSQRGLSWDQAAALWEQLLP